MDKPVAFVLDWFKLTQEQKNKISDCKIVSVKQLLNNSSSLAVNRIADLFDLFSETDQDVVEFTKLLKDIQAQNELFKTINKQSIESFNLLSDNLVERVGSLFLYDSAEDKKYINTVNDHFNVYLHILNNSGIIYTEPQVSGRVNSSFLRKNRNERSEALKKKDYVLLDVDFKACQPSILNSFLKIFPEKDFYTGFANALEISRDEAKDLALKKYIWGPLKHESLNKIYEWRKHFYDRAMENDGAYTMMNGKTLFLNDMDESESLNRYCQAAEAQMIHNLSKSCISILSGRKSYLAAIVYDELVFCIHKNEQELIDELKAGVLNFTENKLEIEMEIIK
jgi:hypothetical protein